MALLGLTTQEIEMFKMPSRIAKMPLRRQKIAVRRMISNKLLKFVGKPNSPLVRAEAGEVIAKKFGMEVCVTVQPFKPVDHITIDAEVVRPNVQIEGLADHKGSPARM